MKLAAIEKLRARLEAAGFGDIREGHGCVFGFIDIENGSRLTDLAESSGLTKQAVGEAVAALEKLGYVDPRGLSGRPAGQDHRPDRPRPRGVLCSADVPSPRSRREWAEELGEDVLAAMRETAQRIVELETAPAQAALAGSKF